MNVNDGITKPAQVSKFIPEILDELRLTFYRAHGCYPDDPGQSLKEAA